MEECNVQGEKGEKTKLPEMKTELYMSSKYLSWCGGQGVEQSHIRALGRGEDQAACVADMSFVR